MLWKGCGFLTPHGKRERGASSKDKREKVLTMKAFQFACHFDSFMELKNLMEQEFSGERGDVFEEVLIEPVEEREPLVDGDENLMLENVLIESVEQCEPLVDGDEDLLFENKFLSDIFEHVRVDQRTGSSTSQRGTYNIN